MTPTADKLVGLLATPARLQVVAAVVLGATGPAAIAAATGLGEDDVAAALTKLIRGGVMRAEGGVLSVDADVFAAAARAAADRKAESDDATTDFGVSDPKVAAVLRSFIVDNRLATIPAPGRKRRIVLEYLVAAFEPGQRYPEREVNVILGAFHPDTAALRRYLVVEGFLARENSVYRRSGGWVDVL